MKVGKECIETNYTSVEGAPGFLFSGDPLNKTSQFMWVSQHSRADLFLRIVFFKPIQLGSIKVYNYYAPGMALMGLQILGLKIGKHAPSRTIQLISGVAIRMNTGELNGVVPQTIRINSLGFLSDTRESWKPSPCKSEWPLNVSLSSRSSTLCLLGNAKECCYGFDCCRIGAINTTSDSTDWSYTIGRGLLS